MTNGENYDGAIESAKQLIKLGRKVYHFYAGPKMPSDPKEILKLRDQVREEEHLRIKAEKAKEDIKRIWKERDREARLKRRAKIKKILHLKTK